MYDDNVDLSWEGIYIWYNVPQQTTSNVTIVGGGVSPVTTINVDSGGPITGPVVTVTGGVSGFTFVGSASTITLTSPLTAKGDLYTRNSTTGTRLPVGSNGFVLSADSGSATGLKWVAATSGNTTSADLFMLMGA